MDEGGGFSLGEWRGFEQYKCAFCAWDTLDRDEMVLHLARLHAPKPAQRVELPLVDHKGDPLVVVRDSV
jgi:hypothetical protein